MPMDSQNKEKLEALLETLSTEEKEETVDLESTVEESTEKKDESVASEEPTEEVEVVDLEEKATEDTEKEPEMEAEAEDDEEDMEEEEEEKSEEEEVEEKTTGATDEEPEEEGEVEPEEEGEEEPEEEEEPYGKSEEIEGGRRVVLVSTEKEPEVEEKNEELLERRNELIAELAQIDQTLTKDEEPEVEDDEQIRGLRVKRLMAMGYKEEEASSISEDAILCAVERKMLPNSEPCAFCRGGCAAEKGLPGLLDIEAEAMESFKGEVLDSGYAPNDDLFVVDIKTEDGRTIEAFYDGAGVAAGWVLLAQPGETEEKSEVIERQIISMQEAEGIALKSVDGVVLGVDASVFEGYDSWAVQIEGIDGKSYDTYVGLDGTVLGFDEYDPTGLNPDLTDEEKAEIKAIEAELYFKREFSRERREELAGEGHALPDGSFPIANVNDLRNAIQAIGRAKNPEVAKAHIMKRAAQLGREDLIPDSWSGGGKSEDAEFLRDFLDFQNLSIELE